VDPAAAPAWLRDLLPAEARERAAEALRGAASAVRASALSPLARAMAVAALAEAVDRPLLAVVPDDAAARKLEAELAALLDPLSGVETLRFPALDADPYRGMPAHPSAAARRVAVLDRLARGGRIVVVVPAAALLVPVPRAATVAAWARDVRPGAILPMEETARLAVRAGYRVVDVVGGPGDFARRGGLFDVWPPQEDAPLRVELFGDEVESVRRFDPGTQRTVARIDGFRLLPAREAPIGPEEADALLDRLVGRARDLLAEAEPTEEGLPQLTEQLLAGLEGAPRLYRSDLVAPLDFAPSRLVVVAPEEVREELETRWEDLRTAHGEMTGDRLPPPSELYVPLAAALARLEAAPVEIAETPAFDGVREYVDLHGRPPRRYEGRLEALVDDVRRAASAGRPVVLLARAPGRRDRLKEVLRDAGIRVRRADEDAPLPPDPGEVALLAGALDEGVEFGADGPLVFAEPDLFGADPPPPPSRKRRGGEAFVSDLRDLKLGDLVVHVDHGVGRYLGLSRREATGEEMLLVEYAAGDKLYVPVARLDLIQKYSGAGHAITPLDRLGGPGWERRRRKVGAAVEEMAEELLQLYARRRAARAHACRPDTVWQREFEQAFPHDLTADQGSALADIKGDLEAGRPMDRLLCGDVGFGKTEVALRAAFKTAQEGMQVAVLAPTTVLAFQHLATIRARMAAWPMRVEMISRFVSPADAKRILDDTAKGEVDVLVGTHRLLSKDVRFKRLGLLVVDEEQRFGVRHKEAIKRLSLGVHALALTATPIPRTLQLSLAGVRDLSVIETPPRNRLAIQTQLLPWSPALAAAAIRNELRRGGQVYYITPKVQGIEEVTREVQELAPEARVAHAHGQMPEGQLEQVMTAFVRGDVQVLVATTIIENGLDIPRANTLIVRDAHRFGLAQLYQMRGRVGRSDVRAYAYLFAPPRRELTADARRRLAALVEFTELGAGFRIAALDLEIRGAGEFLGARQSGHIAAVGFELYAQLLEKAVRRLSGAEVAPEREAATVNLEVPASLPEEYVGEAGQRLAVYKRLSAAETAAEIAALRDETVDRFGPLPAPAATLFRLAELRVAAEAQGAIAVDWVGDGVTVRYGARPKIDAERLVDLARSDAGVRLSPAGIVKLRVADPRADRIAAAALALRKLAGPEA